MIIHHCGTENAVHAKFCKACGEKLEDNPEPPVAEAVCLNCPVCTQAYKAGAKFCGKCGVNIAAALLIPGTDEPEADQPVLPVTEEKLPDLPADFIPLPDAVSGSRHMFENLLEPDLAFKGEPDNTQALSAQPELPHLSEVPGSVRQDAPMADENDKEPVAMASSAGTDDGLPEEVMMPVEQVGQPAKEDPVAELPVMPAAKNRSLVKVTVLGITAAVVVSGAAWWLFSAGNVRSTPDTNLTASTGAPAMSAKSEPVINVAAPVTADADEATGSAAVMPVAAEKQSGIETVPAPATSGEQAQLKQQAAAKRRAEAEAQRKLELEAQRKAVQEERRLAAQASRHEAEERSRAEEAQRNKQPQPAAEQRTVQQVCSGGNAFTRSLCELRECARPSRASTAECAQLRENNVQTNPAGIAY